MLVVRRNQKDGSTRRPSANQSTVAAAAKFLVVLYQGLNGEFCTITGFILPAI